MDAELLAEIGCQQCGQSFDSLFLIGTIGNQRNLCALNDPQRQNAQQALGIDTALLHLNPDGAFELICLLDEESSRPSMEPYLIIDNSSLGLHVHSLPNALALLPVFFIIAENAEIVNDLYHNFYKLTNLSP